MVLTVVVEFIEPMFVKSPMKTIYVNGMKKISSVISEKIKA